MKCHRYPRGLALLAALAIISAFLHELRARGWEEGKNLALERRSAEGKFERFGEIVTELVRLKADVIVTVGNLMAQRAQAVTSTVPIVMASSGDPVEAGIVRSLARPGGNVTGVTSDTGPEFEAKRLQLLKEALPRVSRIAFFGLARDWESQHGQGIRAAARALGVTLFPVESTPTQFGDAFAAIGRERPDAVFVAQSPPHWVHRQLIRGRRLRPLPSCRRLHGQDPQGRQAGGPSGRAADEVRAGA